MFTYQQLSDWLKQKENKDRLVIGVCFFLVFLVGYGAGSFEKETRQNNLKPQPNYTTPQAKKPTSQNNLGTEAGVMKAPSTASTTANCIIKGNIASSGKKVYHVQGGAFYKIVKPEECFTTEAEALAAGFVKSSR